MKTIVTHLNPDLDAITSVWLIKRFLPGWEDAEVKFVPAGLNESSYSTKDHRLLTNDQLWVDTGFGELDHHQTGKETCAAVLTWKFIKKTINNYSSSQVRLGEKSAKDSSHPAKRDSNNKRAIDRLVNVVLRIDFHAEDITMKNAADDFYAFMFNERQILRGIRSLYRGQSDKHLEYGFQTLDAILAVIKMKIEAEDIIKNGIHFSTKWGNGVGAETANEMYMHIAQEIGYKVVVSKDPKKGHIRIHGLPQSGIDFTDSYQRLKTIDQQATWYLHPSKSLLLNGSSANPNMRPTRLELREIIEVLVKE